MGKNQTLGNPVFVWVSDIHINSKQALSLPEVDKGDDDYHRANAIQRALYIAWQDAWQIVRQKAGKSPIVVCFGGEIIDIDAKDRSNQFITRDLKLAQDHAMELILPIIEIASKIIVLRGTEAHVGMNGKMDEAMGERIDKVRKKIVLKNGKEYSWHHLRCFIGGRKFDLAHHVNMGNSPRTERDAANHVAADLIMQYRGWNETLPDFAFRGHVHRFSDSSFNYPTRVLISGCWQMATSFIHRIGKGASRPEIGLYFCDPARKEVEKIEYDYKREAPEHI
jgi:hypothetical protein